MNIATVILIVCVVVVLAWKGCATLGARRLRRRAGYSDR